MNITQAKTEQYSRQRLIEKAEVVVSCFEELEAVGVFNKSSVEIDFNDSHISITLSHGDKISVTVTKNDI